jgi:hypothetical protein
MQRDNGSSLSEPSPMSEALTAGTTMSDHHHDIEPHDHDETR